MKICTKVNQYLTGKGVNLGRSGPLYRARKARMARETLLKWLESHETSRDELLGQPRLCMVLLGRFKILLRRWIGGTSISSFFITFLAKTLYRQESSQ